MSRIYNFSAGPAALPLPVLETIKNDIPDWQGTGMSVMEVSHRGKHFVELATRCEANLRRLLDIPANYSVLWLQGGATMQMAMVPLNLAGPDDTADYVITGSWGKKAAGEAAKQCRLNVAADSGDRNFTCIPDESIWPLGFKPHPASPIIKLTFRHASNIFNPFAQTVRETQPGRYCGDELVLVSK